VQPPPVEDFLHAYNVLERDFRAILVLTLSNHLTPVAQIARQASLQHGGKAQIAVLDSQQAGPGLGMLAQLGAQAILAGASLADIQDHIRAAMTHIYTLIHPGDGGLILTQANVREAELSPLLILEEGRLSPYKQIRTKRHLLESFQEFIEEFETPQQIVLLRGRHSAIRSRPLREITLEHFPTTVFSDMEMPAPLARLFGSQATAMTVLEMPE